MFLVKGLEEIYKGTDFLCRKSNTFVSKYNTLITRYMKILRGIVTLLILFTGLSAMHLSSQNISPQIRFGLIADIQYGDCDTHGARFYRNSLDKLTACVDSLNEERVQFIVNLGDMVDRNPEDIDPVLNVLKNWMLRSITQREIMTTKFLLIMMICIANWICVPAEFLMYGGQSDEVGGEIKPFFPSFLTSTNGDKQRFSFTYRRRSLNLLTAVAKLNDLRQ